MGAGGRGLGASGLLCVSSDIDDCANSPCCQQVCTNSPGGYECSCYAGYQLSRDGCGCEGERGSGAAGERATVRKGVGALALPCALGVGWAPALRRAVWICPLALRPVVSHRRGPAPLAAPSRASVGQCIHCRSAPGGGRVAAAGASLGGHGRRASVQQTELGRRGLPSPRALEDRPQQPPVCPQTWTSARLAEAAVSTTASTWSAPSSVPVRSASGWTRTAGAAPVSPACPRLDAFPECQALCPLGSQLPGWLDLTLALPLAVRQARAAGWGEGPGQMGIPQGTVSLRSWVVQLRVRPGERRDIIPRTEDSVQRGRELSCPLPLLRVQGP